MLEAIFLKEIIKRKQQRTPPNSKLTSIKSGDCCRHHAHADGLGALRAPFSPPPPLTPPPHHSLSSNKSELVDGVDVVGGWAAGTAIAVAALVLPGT